VVPTARVRYPLVTIGICLYLGYIEPSSELSGFRIVLSSHIVIFILAGNYQSSKPICAMTVDVVDVTGFTYLVAATQSTNYSLMMSRELFYCTHHQALGSARSSCQSIVFLSVADGYTWMGRMEEFGLAEEIKLSQKRRAAMLLSISRKRCLSCHHHRRNRARCHFLFLLRLFETTSP